MLSFSQHSKVGKTRLALLNEFQLQKSCFNFPPTVP